MKKEKKENILGSICNAIYQIWQGDHAIVYFSFYKNITEEIFGALFGIYLIKFIYECIEKRVDFSQLFIMVSIFCVVHIIIHLTSAFHSYCQKIAEMKVYRHIFQKIIRKAKRIKIDQYENPDFYDNFSRALDEALEQGIWGMLFTTWGVGAVCGSIVAMVILASVDVMLILFAIPPVIGSLYFGIGESSEQFAARRDGYVVTSISEAIEYFSQAGKLCMYMNNIKEFMECETEELIENAVRPNNTMGEIVFEHVSYHYTGSEQMIIQDLNVTIHQGEHIALVGENGAGKTTLMKLLMGLYPVSEGRILAGNEDIRFYEPSAYRDCFGTVFQDFQIFSLPLGENVLMKSPETEEERKLVVDSLKKAQFGEVLEKMPKGIDTYLPKEFEEEGFVCSGGQAQKIAIARVFAKNPEVVILDEPSSALDPIAEYNMTTI